MTYRLSSSKSLSSNRRQYPEEYGTLKAAQDKAKEIGRDWLSSSDETLIIDVTDSKGRNRWSVAAIIDKHGRPVLQRV